MAHACTAGREAGGFQGSVDYSAVNAHHCTCTPATRDKRLLSKHAPELPPLRLLVFMPVPPCPARTPATHRCTRQPEQASSLTRKRY